MELDHSSEVYEDREDSWLLQKEVERFVADRMPKKVLDVGTGTGIQAITAAMSDATVFALDIDPAAASLAFNNSKFNDVLVHCFCSDLLAALKPSAKFDLITFNPPYLPEDMAMPLEEKDNQMVKGGEGGVEILTNFFKQMKNHLAVNGSVLFVYSSNSDIERLKREIAKLGFTFKNISSQRIFFEEIFVAEARLISRNK